MKTVRLRIKGRVQGVGYRAWVIEQATRLGVRGWVRNRSDGSVEILASGGEGVIAALIDMCRRGPENARVDSLAAAGDEDSGAAGFRARATE